jgi:hypothetical protein
MPPDPAALPRPPDRPDPMECCGRGCSPCIFDYYDDALDRWKAIVAARGFDPAEVLRTLGRPPGG